MTEELENYYKSSQEQIEEKENETKKHILERAGLLNRRVYSDKHAYSEEYQYFDSEKKDYYKFEPINYSNEEYEKILEIETKKEKLKIYSPENRIKNIYPASVLLLILLILIPIISLIVFATIGQFVVGLCVSAVLGICAYITYILFVSFANLVDNSYKQIDTLNDILNKLDK